MKLALWSSEAGLFFQQIKQQGFFHAIKAALWRFRLALSKQYIHLQDQLGWYRYADWIRECETIQVEIPEPGSSQHFLFLIASSAYNPSFVIDTLASLLAQSYPHWEACVYVADSKTLDSLVNSFKGETRIHWSLSAEVLPQIKPDEFTADWLGFLNSGDILSSHALSVFASRLEAQPDGTILYSDTDKVSLDGLTRHDPSFWPDWSPELLLSVNYLSRALFHRQEFVNAAVNSAPLESAILRCTEKASQIIHIPQVLCHIRDGQTPAWFGDSFLPENLIGHLERCGLKDVTYQGSSSTATSQFSWSYPQPMVSIIILTRDRVRLLKRCIDSILAETQYPQYEIILVENHSQEHETFTYYEHLKSNPKVKIFTYDQVFNYSAFNNWAVQHARGHLLLFLNNDIECIDPGWLDEMARWSSRLDVGIVGAKLLHPDHSIQHAGLVVGLEGHANHIYAGCPEGYRGYFGSVDWYRDYSAITGACMMMRKAVFEQIGGFDESYSLAFNDIELCLRAIQAGYRVVYTPFARLIHYEGATRSTYKPPSDIQLASQRLKPLIERGDPFYNPNLSLMRRIPTLSRRGEISPVKKLDLITEYFS